MTPGCVVISEAASVADAAKAMAAHRVHAVLVVGSRNGTPLGWVTHRGLLGWIGRDRTLARATEAITEQVRAIPAHESAPHRALRAVAERHHAPARAQQAQSDAGRRPERLRPRHGGGALTRPKEAAMYRKILVGYDDSDQAKDALALGKQLADATGAELVVAGVFQFDPIWGGFDPHFRDAEVEYARKIEEAAKSVGAEAEATPSSSPARGLHELAEEIEADLIVVGSARHGRVGQILAGSVGVALLHGSPCAVAIAPNGYRDHSGDGIAAIAVGFDGSEESGLALVAATQLASKTDAKLKLVAVAEPPAISMGKGGNAGRHELTEAIQEEMRERLTEARETVPDDIEAEATLITGDPVEALVDVARRRARCWSSARAATARCGGCCSARCRRSWCARRPAR